MSPIKDVALPLVMVFLIAGCQAPFLVFSGGLLEGKTTEVQSFAFAENYRLLRLEVRPAAPYSVILRVTVIDGELYIDAAPNRRWHRYLEADPMVRVKLGDTLYPARAVVVEDPQVVGRFASGRTVYRMVPVAMRTNDVSRGSLENSRSSANGVRSRSPKGALSNGSSSS